MSKDNTEKRKKINEDRRHVMRCSLNILTIIWLIAWVMSYITVAYDDYNDIISSQTWVPFSFIGSTVLWVVLSRVVSTFSRSALFLIWVFSLVLVVMWASTVPVILSAATYGALTMTVVMLSLTILSREIEFDRMFKGAMFYFVVSVMAALATFLAAPYLTNMKTDRPHLEKTSWIYASVAACVVAVATFQIWNIWNYLIHNPHLLLIENTCLFAVMSPWSDTVDTFASLSRFN